jgi:hypothetical protein
MDACSACPAGGTGGIRLNGLLDNYCVEEATVLEGALSTLEDSMRNNTGQKKQKCKNCEGKGTLKKEDKIVRCQRCGGSGIKP